MLKTSFALLLSLLLINCGSHDDTAQTTFRLKINGCTPVFEDQWRICLDSVFNDSRCPLDLQCVWEGDAIARFQLTKDQKITRFDLHVNPKFKKDTSLYGITVQLLDLSPYPLDSQEIDPSDYIAEIFVGEK